MKRSILGIAALCAMIAILVGRAVATDYESHVYMDNKSDAFVWVTAYFGRGAYSKALGAWCVLPRTMDQHGLRDRVYEVRVEVSHNGCQRNPVRLNQLRGFPTIGTNNKMTYFVRGTLLAGYTYGNY